MRTLVVTLIGPDQRVDLQLPAEIPLQEILPTLVELGVSHAPSSAPSPASGWQLMTANNGAVLEAKQSLDELGIVDGAILLLREQTRPRGKRMSIPTSVPPHPGVMQSGPQTGGIGVRRRLPASAADPLR